MEPEPTNGSSSGAPRPLENFAFTFKTVHEGIPKRRSQDADAEDDDDDSQSVSSSVRHFPEEFGRTYHAYQAGSYAYPNDEQERKRLEFQNMIVVELLGKKQFLAPWTDEHPPNRVLDIATGTGHWAIDIGDQFPEAQVVGIDLSPIQETHVPPNVWFYIQDAAAKWEFAETFDYIHSRATLGCFSDFKSSIVQQAFDHLEPGGYLETSDFMARWQSDDGTLTEDSALSQWGRDINAAADALDRPVCVADQHARWLKEVGFVDVKEWVFKVPMNGWPRDKDMKKIGHAWEENFLDGLSGFTLALFSRVLKREVNDILVSLAPVRADIQNRNIHSYQTFHVTVGRKPYPHEFAQRLG